LSQANENEDIDKKASTEGREEETMNNPWVYIVKRTMDG
jgi:hypothetical protein